MSGASRLVITKKLGKMTIYAEKQIGNLSKETIRESKQRNKEGI